MIAGPDGVRRIVKPGDQWLEGPHGKAALAQPSDDRGSDHRLADARVGSGDEAAAQRPARVAHRRSGGAADGLGRFEVEDARPRCPQRRQFDVLVVLEPIVELELGGLGHDLPGR